MDGDEQSDRRRGEAGSGPWTGARPWSGGSGRRTGPGAGPADALPWRPFARTARLASLPLGFAGRSVAKTGRRLLGEPGAALNEEFQRRAAEQLFTVLGGLKGGAMKVGQLLSVFEAALPPSAVAPYRAALTRLQEAAPPLAAEPMRGVLAAELGADWPELFAEFDEAPVAAASIGQVHRARWRDGRAVAVKIQYPNAREALLGDYERIGSAIRVLSLPYRGLDIGPMVAELKSGVAEELDYRLEAAAQQAFAEAYRDDPDIHVPAVVAHTGRVLVTEWLPGRPLAEVIAQGTAAERDSAGLLLARFLLSGPERARMLHADPHPGNFRLLPDGRLGVLDFGAVKRLPDGLPNTLGSLQRLAEDGEFAAAEELLRQSGFLRRGVVAGPELVAAFLGPLAEPLRGPEFRFDRAWLREELARTAGPGARGLVRKLNLPPEYLLINRAVTAGCAVLCQLDCVVPFRAEALRWLPGFAGPAAGGR
ncbi:ABC1 kinase family protein [Kitasatospora sp. NPDC056651]|uniref:ABC1 kinase family protein n=1 Tax=Kitasatospora sp. NPDC056651 TaxID=3345892 RepID=UPI00369D0836